MTVDHIRFSLYVERDEVQGGGARGRRAFVGGAVGEKSSQILRGFALCTGTSGRRSTDVRMGNCLAYAGDCVIVEPDVLVLCSFPVVVEIGLVPNFPVPGGNRPHDMTLNHMRGYLAGQLLPPLVIFGTKRPAFFLPGLERP